jgi:LemA protein
MKKVLLIVVGLLAFLVLAVGMGGCGSYNGMVGRKQDVDKAWAQVEAQYQRRFDLVPNLVKTVEGSANFERSVLKEITEARASVGHLKLTPGQAPATAAEFAKFQEAQGQLASALSRLLVVSERYPDLKTTSAFRDLQVQIEGTENRIAVARNDFNTAVQGYNTAVQQFPGVIVARLGGFTPRPYFQSDAAAAKAPKVEFNLGAPAK